MELVWPREVGPIMLFSMIFSARLGVPAQGYTLNLTDCTQPTAIRRFNAHTFCPPVINQPEVPTNKQYTILQMETVREQAGYSCEVRRSEFSYKCGAWGHLKVQRIPRIRHSRRVPTATCNSMIRTGTYGAVHGGENLEVKLNTWVHIDVEERGALLEEDNAVSCKGEDVHVDGLLHSNMLILSEYSVLIRVETFLIYQGKVEVKSESLSLDCPYADLGCVTGTRTYTWAHSDVQCPLRIVKSIHPSWVMDTFFIDHEEQFFINTTNIVKEQNCPFPLLATSHPSIFLALTSTVTDLPIIPAVELDLVLQTNTHLNYMGFVMQRDFQRQLEKANLHVCQAHQHQEVHQVPFILPDGEYGYRQGDLFLKFQCETKVATISEDSENCFRDIPIDDPAGFVNPQNKLFVAHSPKVPCSTSFPLTIKANEGWVQLTPLPKKCPPPMDMPLPGDPPAKFDDFSHGGLYSAAELTEWQHQLTFPSYHKALLQSITYGVCQHEGRCPVGHAHIDAYDLGKLVPEVATKLTLFAGLTQFLHTYGDLMALICLVILTIKFASDILCITLAAIRAGPGAAAAMFGQIYLVNRATYQKLMRRYQATRNPPTATAPMELAPLNPAGIYPRVPQLTQPTLNLPSVTFK